MSSQFLNNFCLYQSAMRRIGQSRDVMSAKFQERDADDDINDLVSATSNAEHNLTEVISVTDSYNEILKMIM